MADGCKQRDVVADLKNEVLVYEHLAALQGKVIPDLLAGGFWRDEYLFFLATAVVEGEQPSSATADAYPEAEKALRKIHAMGVVHRAVRRRNMLVARKGRSFKVWFLDFETSRIAAAPEEFDQDMADLRRVFRRSD
ncbi:hypothetical protein MNEG_9747 [Monoraphidium neglectum]|uniref:Protein kinase domain-containing protein n=1 Tax=Monoraphidium neglectum TaxID=145388 RepID=A0A0D2JFG8_9CHLO|nr:hypothetical protein MNEG_9747 [Monoraphidium neglectum]KIY98217.1 hypothetical protein MNEG_9747 [Monoraphidium neglectum]|eukprot:XP_013897237.1 hypothetical protein MNEG_9747 [Monoraphidium neglectum]